MMVKNNRGGTGVPAHPRRGRRNVRIVRSDGNILLALPKERILGEVTPLLARLREAADAA